MCVCVCVCASVCICVHLCAYVQVYVCDGMAIGHGSFCELTICTACEGTHGGSEAKEGTAPVFVRTFRSDGRNLMCVAMKFYLNLKSLKMRVKQYKIQLNQSKLNLRQKNGH